MDRAAAAALTRSLLDAHGFDRWTFRFNRHKTSLGLCDNDRRRIELSGPLTDINDRACVEDTIRHEIAHALAGYKAGHGPEWRRACTVTGARPQRCATDATSLPHRWRGTCPDPECNYETGRHRLAAKVRRHVACPRCCWAAGDVYDARFRLRWTDRGTGAGDVVAVEGPGRPPTRTPVRP